jgi:hypothetical protein
MDSTASPNEHKNQQALSAARKIIPVFAVQ